MIICETARKDFLDIANTLGGKNEKLRTESFISKLKILPDITTDEQNELQQLSKLSINGKIKPRSFQIFSFGMYHKAITVSSNEGFVRAAKMQVIFVLIIH